MDIRIIGAGLIGSILARRLSKLSHKAFIANSRSPASFVDLSAETGAEAVTMREAAGSREIVFVSIPEWKVAELPKDLFYRVDPDVAVVDTANYYSRERDGRIDEIEDGMAESRWVANRQGKLSGSPGRIALPVAGDDMVTKAKVIRLFDQLGFDGVNADGVDESWRQQPSTPVYAANLDKFCVCKAFSEERPVRKLKISTLSNRSIGKPL